MDFSNITAITIPEGTVTKIVSAGVTLWEAIKNWVRYAIDTDGSLYNNCGYMNEYRLTSSGGISSQANCVITGFIPVEAGDTIRIKGGLWYNTASAINYIIAYNDSFAKVYTGNAKNTYQTSTFIENMSLENDVSIIKLKSGVSYKYIRLSVNDARLDGAKLIVTINEEIV
jgi:hypothetical protein